MNFSVKIHKRKMEFDEKMERYNMQYDKFTVEKRRKRLKT
mgnify:CR=1 FL=1